MVFGHIEKPDNHRRFSSPHFLSGLSKNYLSSISTVKLSSFKSSSFTV